jgi:hypothetical protein
MTTWWIGSKDDKNYQQIYDAMDVMKTGDTVECDDLGKDQFIAFLKSAGRWNDLICGFQATEHIFFDGGGSVSTEEPMIAWEANNGAVLKTYVRHLPFILESFRRLKPDKNLPDLRAMRGFCRLYIISGKTIAESIEAMERLQKGTESLRQELELSMQQGFNKMSHGFSARKCGCMSGRIYVECCGKSVESPSHKEVREAVDPKKPVS